MKQHRWSGWPGAICMVCGMEDQIEYCVATSCPDSFITCDCETGCEFCCGTGTIPGDCEVHVNGSCPGFNKDELN